MGRPLIAGGWSLVVLAWSVCLVATGSPAADLARWLAAVLAGVLLPGIALVRAVRAAAAPLIEDLAWGAATGCVVGLAGWFLDVTLPWAPPPWLWGPLVAAGCLVPRRTRDRVLARPATGWGTRPNLTLAATMLVAIGWMTADYLRYNPLDPGPAGHTYYPDTLFQLAVVGQLRHSPLPGYPLVHGEPFAYHWFLHAVLAHLLTGTGIDPFDAVLRLTAPTIVPAVLLLTAVLARRLAGRVLAGPVAAVLLAVVGTTIATVWSTDGQSQLMIGTYWAASLTSAFGWLAALAATGCCVGYLRAGPPDAAIPRRLLVPLTILAAGAKSADLAVLVAGVAAAAGVALLTRQRVRPALAVTAVVAATLLVARYTLYGGTGYGLRLRPLAGIVTRATALFPGLVRPTPGHPYLVTPALPAVAVLAALALWLVPLLPRLAGLPLLLRHRAREPVSWLPLGTVLAGFGGTLAFRQPGSSEICFLLAAYPIGIAGSAAGLTELTPGRATRVGAVLGAGAGLLATIGIAAFAGHRPPLAGWTQRTGAAPTAGQVGVARQILWWVTPLLVLLGGLAVLAVAAWGAARMLRRRRPALRPAVTAAILAALFGTGLLSTGLYATGTAGTPSYNRVTATTLPGIPPTTRDELAAGRWLAAHSGPSDVLAVNEPCLQPAGAGACTAKDFTFAAFAGRDTDVGGWAYAPRNLDSAWNSAVWYADQPFWDPARLAGERAAFTRPTADLLDRLDRVYGVRWLVAERTGWPPATALLDTLATRRLTLATVTVWELGDNPFGSR